MEAETQMQRTSGRRSWRVVGFLVGVLVLPWMFPLLGIVALNALGASIDVSDPAPALQSPSSAGAQGDGGENRDVPPRPHAALLRPGRGDASSPVAGTLAASHR